MGDEFEEGNFKQDPFGNIKDTFNEQDFIQSEIE